MPGPLPASAAVASIVSLPHPQSGTPTKFLWRDGALFEIQRAQSRDPRSWFIDNYVQHSERARVVHTVLLLTLAAGGRLLMGTRMDPGFLLLYLLARAPPKLVALDQLLTEHVRAFPALRQLQPQLQRAAPRMADVDGAPRRVSPAPAAGANADRSARRATGTGAPAGALERRQGASLAGWQGS